MNLATLIPDQFGDLKTAHLVLGINNLWSIDEYAFRGIQITGTGVDITANVLMLKHSQAGGAISHNAFICASMGGGAVTLTRNNTLQCPPGFSVSASYVARHLRMSRAGQCHLCAHRHH